MTEGEKVGNKYKAAIFVGKSPTISSSQNTAKKCEAFLLDFEGEIPVGSEIRIDIFEKIRDIEKFENSELLKKQISKDVEFVKSWYNSKR